MTHGYLYLKEGLDSKQIELLVLMIKNVLEECLFVPPAESTVAVKELSSKECSSNFESLLILYTPSGKEREVKELLASTMHMQLSKVSPQIEHFILLIKEQRSDMAGLNGVMQIDNQ